MHRIAPVEFPSVENNEVSKYMHDQRITLQVKEEQDMMLGIAWFILVKSDYFRLFPEVVFVDCIEQVNKDSRAALFKWEYVYYFEGISA